MCLDGIGSKRLSFYGMIRPRIEYGSLRGFLLNRAPDLGHSWPPKPPPKGKADLPVTLVETQSSTNPSLARFSRRDAEGDGCQSTIMAGRTRFTPIRGYCGGLSDFLSGITNALNYGNCLSHRQ